MANKGKSAWLVTWEGPDAERFGRCKCGRNFCRRGLAKENIALLLRTLFCSEYPLTLCEKTLPRNVSPKRTCQAFSDDFTGNINQAFSNGHFPKDYLYAREVKELRCEVSKESVSKCTLCWIELAKYVPVTLDPSAPLPARSSKLTKIVESRKSHRATHTRLLYLIPIASFVCLAPEYGPGACAI
jgi:hypothetical protein